MSDGTAVDSMAPVKKKLRIIPREDRVTVRPDEVQEFTDGGIALPDLAQEKPNRGTVIEVGNDPKVADLKPGVIVYYPKHAGSAVGKGKDLIMKSFEIIAYEG